MIYRLSLARPQPQKGVKENAAQLLFLSCLHSEKEIGKQVSLVTVSLPSLTTVAPSPSLPLHIKDSLKEVLMDGFAEF
jgi:hypothetical protein